MKYCRVSNCKNHANGIICTTHRYRWNTYKSYDLPDYMGEPNYLTDIPLSEGKVTRCKIHGELSKNQTYIRYYKGKENSFYCKECSLGLNIRNKYKGLSGLDDYYKMLEKQNGVCWICKGKNNTTRNGKIKRFAIDHCHKTGNVRKLLCSFCNSMIGYAKDDPFLLSTAIVYLTENDTENDYDLLHEIINKLMGAANKRKRIKKDDSFYTTINYTKQHEEL